MVTVYIPKSEIETVASGKRPSEYWTFKPYSWNSSDLVMVQIPIQTLSEWNNRNSGKMLLKD